WQFLLELTGFFFVAMYCHGELAQNRPPARHLTEFYLWMSLGGVLGGLFNSLVAPLLFKTAAEYPLVLVLACLLMPLTAPQARNAATRWLEIIGSTLVCGTAAGFLLKRVLDQLRPESPQTQFIDLRSLESLVNLSRVQLIGLFAAGLLLGLLYIVRRKDDAANRALDLLVPVALAVVAFELILRLPGILTTQTTVDSSAGTALTRVVLDFGRVTFDWDWLNMLFLKLGVRLDVLVKILTYSVLLVLCYVFVERPVRFGLGVGAVLLVSSVYKESRSDTVFRARSFFGALQI